MDIGLRTAGQFQNKVFRENTTLLETLGVLIIGGIGMGISIMGAVNNNPLIYGLGLIIMVLSAIYIGAKVINEILDLIDRFKKRRKS